MVDLRWGVNEESQKDHKTMAICLGEINRCQQLTPKPNFLILLGDRYGWEPIPAKIVSTEFEELLNVATLEEKETLNEWYLEDNNASPPEYYLKRREGEFEEYEDWEKVESSALAYSKQHRCSSSPSSSSIINDFDSGLNP